MTRILADQTKIRVHPLNPRHPRSIPPFLKGSDTLTAIHPELQAAFDWIDAHRAEAIADLQRFVQQKSVSAQNIGLEECAQLVVAMMHADGLDATAYPTPGGPPCIICLLYTSPSPRDRTRSRMPPSA